MAIIKKSSSSMGLPMNITRGNPIPIDNTSIWYSLQEAQEYARTGATAYVGQRLSIVDENNNTTKVYVIANKAGDLIDISSSGSGSGIEDNTIILYGGSASEVLDEEADT